MPLKKTDLETQIKAAFKKAKDTPPPSDPADASKVQEQINTQLAKDLADAIEAFVKSGDVTGVSVKVKNEGGVDLGTGEQTGVGKVQ